MKRTTTNDCEAALPVINRPAQFAPLNKGQTGFLGDRRPAFRSEWVAVRRPCVRASSKSPRRHDEIVVSMMTWLNNLRAVRNLQARNDTLLTSTRAGVLLSEIRRPIADCVHAYRSARLAKSPGHIFRAAAWRIFINLRWRAPAGAPSGSSVSIGTEKERFAFSTIVVYLLPNTNGPDLNPRACFNSAADPFQWAFHDRETWGGGFCHGPCAGVPPAVLPAGGFWTSADEQTQALLDPSHSQPWGLPGKAASAAPK